MLALIATVIVSTPGLRGLAVDSTAYIPYPTESPTAAYASTTPAPPTSSPTVVDSAAYTSDPPTQPPTTAYATPPPTAAPIVLIHQKVPDISIDSQDISKYGFDVTVSAIACNKVDVGRLEITAQALDTPVTASKSAQLDLLATDIVMECSANYEYKLDFWPYVPRGDGSVILTAGGGSNVAGRVDVHGLGFGLTAPATLELVPGTCTGQVDVLEQEVHFSGGLSGSILNKFKKEVASVVEKLASNKVCGALSTEIPKLDTSAFSEQLLMLSMMV